VAMAWVFWLEGEVKKQRQVSGGGGSRRPSSGTPLPLPNTDPNPNPLDPDATKCTLLYTVHTCLDAPWYAQFLLLVSTKPVIGQVFVLPARTVMAVVGTYISTIDAHAPAKIRDPRGRRKGEKKRWKVTERPGTCLALHSPWKYAHELAGLSPGPVSPGLDRTRTLWLA
jgi:hypothetical protein